MNKNKSVLAVLLASVVFAGVLIINSGASASNTSELLPISDGFYSEWIPKSGSIHYTMVDEASCNGKTDFVRTTVIGERDSYGVSLSSVPDGATITGVTISVCASRQATGVNGSSTINVFYRWNGFNGSDKGDYSLVNTVTPVDLVTTTVWTGLSLPKTSTSTLEIGVVLSSGNKGARLGRISTVLSYTSLPAAPSSLSATSPTSSVEADLAWTDNSSDEEKFYVERGTDGVNFAAIATTSPNAISYQDLAVSALTTYYYRVRAWNFAGFSDYSNVASTTTNIVLPAAPSNLFVFSSTTPWGNSVNWLDNANNENLFSVERSIDGGAFGQVATTSANIGNYFDTSLVVTSTPLVYSYRVRAQNTFGYSGYSNISSTTNPVPLPSAPSNLLVFPTSTPRGNNLSWNDNSSNENLFRIERSIDGGAFSQIATTTANFAFYSDTSLFATSTILYSYRVRAENTFGLSGYSNIASTTNP